MDALSQYLNRENCTQTALAAKLGVSHSTLSRILSGDRQPSVALTKRIEAVTGIPRIDLRPDIFGDAT
jgi:transcriptional regulator with XRE-family HTH domain